MLIERLTKISDLLNEIDFVICQIEYESPQYEHINHIKETINELINDMNFEIISKKEIEKENK